MSKFKERREKERQPSKNIVVMYHANCSDGFGGAYSAWKKFGNKAEYIAVKHQEPPPSGLKNKEIYTIDFTYPLNYTKKLIKENRRVTAIDHHVSAKAVTEITENHSYALNNSGSVLAWKYFHPQKPVPKLLKHIEDMDLWKFKLPYTKEIFVFMDLYDFEFKTWDKLVRNFEKPVFRKKYIEEGKVVLRHENKLVERLVANNAEEVVFEGQRTLAINSPNFQSQIGSALYKEFPPMAIVWHYRADKISVSLRSDGSVDVSKMAAKYDGGGHRASAAFKIDFKAKLPWRVVKK